ncbi:MAG: hypothetical protein JSS32_09105 [Verrucomicrobia bacterium]|nr:hypothetical protein [Verrucomicrobiota bacterium]
MSENISKCQAGATTHAGAALSHKQTHKHSHTKTAHKDSSFLNNWISTFLKLVDNILSNYGLQNSENKINELLASNLEAIGNQNNKDLTDKASDVLSHIGKDDVAYYEEQFSITQTSANQKMQRPQQELDQYTQLTKDNSSSTDTEFQIIQTVQTIPQNSNSK